MGFNHKYYSILEQCEMQPRVSKMLAAWALIRLHYCRREDFKFRQSTVTLDHHKRHALIF